MDNELLVTLEILVVVVAPLLYLYLKGRWSLRTTVPCLLILPVLWYLTYSPLHELSHIAGAYLVGGNVVHAKLIPSFWLGEFGRAWITTDGLGGGWRQLAMTSSPYVLDTACVLTGLCLLRRGFSGNPFVIGLLFMLLCLRPAFDFVCETVAFSLGDRGDVYHVAGMVGKSVTWLLMVVLIGLSACSIVIVLRRFAAPSNL